MTEEEWVRAEEPEIRVIVMRLSPRRQRLLAVALVRSLGKWADQVPIVTALNVAERFADTGKSKAALRRARQSLQDARVALGDPRADPVAWATNEGVYLALWSTSVACSENAVGATAIEALRTLREADGLSAEGARRVLYPPFCDVVGPQFRLVRPVTFSAEWRTSTAVALANGMYESRDFGAMPILADALQDAGCDDEQVLHHCRDPKQVHVRGCWVVDLVLEKG